MNRAIACFVLPIALLLGGCSTVPAPGPSEGSSIGSDLPKKERSALEEAAIASAIQQAASAKKSDYKIRPTDLLEISVYREKDLERVVRVSQNGSITFPLVGAMDLTGMSVGEAETAIAGKLSEYLVDPQVSIFVKEYSNKLVYILGEVSKPGSYPLPNEAKLSVVEAITLAGGFTPIAAKDRTRVVRNVNGENKTFYIEVTAITNKGEKHKDIQLEPNDIVYVPQSMF